MKIVNTQKCIVTVHFFTWHNIIKLSCYNCHNYYFMKYTWELVRDAESWASWGPTESDPHLKVTSREQVGAFTFQKCCLRGCPHCDYVPRCVSAHVAVPAVYPALLTAWSPVKADPSVLFFAGDWRSRFITCLDHHWAGGQGTFFK